MSESSLLGGGKLKKQDTASLISALVSQHRAIAESAAKAAELKANAVDIDTQLANIIDSTLHEAIENDRRLTTRNIVRWIDLVTAEIINCHRAFVSPGKFTAEDIILGNKQALNNIFIFTEKSISRMKTDNEYLSLTDEQTIDSKSMTNSIEGDRLAALDFLRRTLLYRKSMERSGSTSQPTELPDWMPKGFECATLARFDHKHDGNITIATGHGLQSAVAKAYRAFGRAVWQDLRCLGIIILEIYTLSVFRQEEVDSLMHWPVPIVIEKEEDSDEDGAPLGGTSLKTLSTGGSNSVGDPHKKGGKAAISGPGLQSKTLPLSLATKRSTSPSYSSSTGKAAAAKRPEAAKTATTSSLSTVGPGSLASGSVSELKSTAPREPRLPSALELSLLPSYPCIARMPGPVKDLLLNVCFTRPQEAVVECHVKHRGEDSTRLECPLLAMLRQARRDLHELAEKLDADSHYVAPNLWTEEDERARLAAHQERRDRMAQKAELGPAKAEARLQHERYLLWYSMQSEDFRERLEARKRARKRAERHTIMRRKYIYQASYHRWNMVNFAAWVQEAVLDYCGMLLELRTSALQAKKKQKKKPAVYVARLLNDLQTVFTQTAINKLVAYREKRIDVEGEKFERALVFVRPSTSGGDRRALAVTELFSLGLLKGERTSTSRGSDFHGDALVMHTEPSSAALATTLPAIQTSIEKKKQRAEQRSQQRRAVTASKDQAVLIKEPNQAEILSDCFATMAAVLSHLILRKQRNPMALCATMRQAVTAQEKESAEAVSERVLVTSEQQLYFKRLYMEAGYFSTFNKHLRQCLAEFCDDIELLDRGWIKYLLHLLSCAIMHQFHTYATNRNKGEQYAADRLIAFFRGIVVRNIISRVWQRTNTLLAINSSPASSTRCGSKRTTPAQSLRKHISLASRSNDTKDSRDTRARTQSNTDLSLAPSIPSLPVRPHRCTERRKPLCFRSVETPTARSMRIDLNVSIDSDNHHSSIEADDRDGLKVRTQLAKRYEDWRNVRCVAYIETDFSEEPVEVVSKQGPADTGMFVADTLQQQEPTAHVRVRNIEQPIKRRLVICLFGPEKKSMVETESAKIVNALQTADATFKKETALVAIDVSDGIPDERASDGREAVLPFLAGTGAAEMGTRYGGFGASDDAWDDRSIESLTRPAGKGLRPESTLPAPPPQPLAHTVVSYRIQLDELPAFSCYSLRLEFDKHLADDLRQGNKTYFRYISLLDENDDLSLGSGDSLREIKFAEVGKQWAIRMEETIEINSTDGASIEAFSGMEMLAVELEQYVYTRAGPPRTVKGLTAKVAYNSADLSMLISTHTHAPCSTALVQFLPASAPDPLLFLGQTTSDLRADADSALAVRAAVQGCTLLHWRHSADDNHANTHYEVQRRLLLICAAGPTRVSLSRTQSIWARPHSRNHNQQQPCTDEPPFAAKSADEVIYAGPWKHVAGLKTSLADPKRTTTSTKRVNRRPVADMKENETAAWSFPLHGNSCTDKVSLPEELDANPDAYNCLVGYLCACFPDLVLAAARGKNVCQSSAAPSRPLSPVNSPSLMSYTPSLGSAATEEDSPVLHSVVKTELRLAFEYRVRAVNSTGPGKFNAISAVTSLQYMLHDGRKPVRLCVTPIAQVCCHLASLRDFRAQHSKYRSHNTDLVSSVLAQRAEELRDAAEVFEVEPSGDPFVTYLVAAKDEALGIAPGHQLQDTVQQQLQGGPAEGEGEGDEGAQISSWLRALELECPL